jgi:hypothetical protein
VCVLHWTSLPLCGTGTPEKALVDDGHRLGWVGLVFDGQLGPRPDRSVITWYSVCLALPRINNIASPTYLTTSIFHIYNSSCPVSQMAPRTSAQARGAARKQAYPPSKQSSDSQSRSPEARRTRSTRSASRDLDASDTEGPGYTRVRRSTRQASVDSEASVADSVNESSRLDNRQSRSSRVQESAG